MSRLRQKFHRTFLDILYKTALPRHVDITLEINDYEYGNDFIYELEKRFQQSNAQYFKFKLVSYGLIGDKQWWNDHGTLEMKVVSSISCDNGSRLNTVIIEQRPHTFVFDQQST